VPIITFVNKVDREGRPVFLQEVATVRDGPLPAQRYVWHGVAGTDGGEHPAVTLSITKKPGENAIDVAQAVMRRVDELEAWSDVDDPVVCP
jgi:multidrug efflux pump subunit AcrB